MLPALFVAAASAGVVIAVGHGGQSLARSHAGIVMRRSSGANTTDVEKRDAYSGVPMTWYPTDTGADACTGKNHLSTDWVVAMNFPQFGSEGSACCGKKLRINYNGKSAVATCVDECATCPDWGALDLTEGLFEYFVGDPGIGEFWGSWSFADDDSSPPTTTTTTKKTTTSTTHTSTHSTTTTHTTSTTHTSTTHTSTTTTHSSTTHSSSSSTTHSSSSSSAKPSSSSASASSLPTAAAAAAAADAAGEGENVQLFGQSVMRLLNIVLQGAAAGAEGEA